jgi:hypothetical protein
MDCSLRVTCQQTSYRSKTWIVICVSNPCLTTVWGLLTSYTQATIHVVLRYEVCWQVTHRLQSISYSDMRFVDMLHADMDCSLRVTCQQTSYRSKTWIVICVSCQQTSYRSKTWIVVLTSYTQATIHVVLRYEVCWQVTHRLQSISYSGMRFVDMLPADYNPNLIPELDMDCSLCVTCQRTSYRSKT